MAHPQKDLIIASIEDESRDGDAFDERQLEVLRKQSCADLFVLQNAFRQAFEAGRKRERDE